MASPVLLLVDYTTEVAWVFSFFATHGGIWLDGAWKNLKKAE